MSTITPVRTGVVIAAIYAALLRQSTLYGGELIAATEFKSGSVYPSLEKLCQAGILERVDERPDPADMRSKRRTVYQLSEEGRAHAVNELRRLGLLPGADDDADDSPAGRTRGRRQQ